jgi:hypothetical protein
MSLLLLLAVRVALAITPREIDEPNLIVEGYLRLAAYILAFALIAVVLAYKICRNRTNRVNVN